MSIDEFFTWSHLQDKRVQEDEDHNSPLTLELKLCRTLKEARKEMERMAEKLGKELKLD